MLEYVPAALSSLGAASNIISGLIKLRDFNKYATELTELQGHIIQANGHIISEQQAHSALTAKVEELEKECMRLKDWSAEKDKYEERNIAPGVFAYILRDYKGPFEQTHKLCCNCFDKTIKSKLQQSQTVKQPHGLTYILKCPNKCPDLEFAHYLS